ncbi:cyclic AMP-dependent transcription factor ATF-4-like [Argonauta hians]
MITERSMDMELNDSELDFLGGGSRIMDWMKGDQVCTGTFADSLSDSTSFLKEKERMNDLDMLPYDKILTPFVVDDSGSNVLSLQDCLFDPSLALYSDMEAFSSFDQQSYDVLMSSPLSCNDLDSVLNTNMIAEEHVEPAQVSTMLSLPDAEEGLSLLSRGESYSSDAFASSPSTSGIDCYSFEMSSPSSSCFSSQPGSPFQQVTITHSQPETPPDSPPQSEKFQGKLKRSKSSCTKNARNHSPYFSSSKSTDSSPSSSPLHDSNTGINDQQLNKKEKKKLQNKNAAIRYRQKMKAEAKIRLNEEEQLLQENVRLKEKAEDLERQIRYLSDLMEEVKRKRQKLSRSS